MATSRTPSRSLDPSSLQHLSLLLAGQQPAPDARDPVETQALDLLWKRHAEEMTQLGGAAEPRLDALWRWRTEVLAEPTDPARPLLAPAFGLDVVAAMVLFPNAPRCVLIGSVAPGRLPLPERLADPRLTDDLERLRRALTWLIAPGEIDSGERLGGRRSDALASTLHGSRFEGVLPIILVALVKAGGRPLAVDYVRIDPVTLDLVPLPPDEIEASMVRVQFTTAGDRPPEVRELVYAAADLSDDHLLSDAPLAQRLELMAPFDALLIAGDDRVDPSDRTTLRELLLTHAARIVQDDSGIPLRFLTSDRWRLAFYGRYDGTPGPSGARWQEDLAAIFARGDGVQPLGVSLDAGQSGEGHVMVATRTAATIAP
ncbi:MAG: hypothetical protein AAGN46_07025 [Acidobacteriota bacterium]